MEEFKENLRLYQDSGDRRYLDDIESDLISGKLSLSDVDEDGLTPLMLTVQFYDAEKVLELLLQFANVGQVNRINIDGNTALTMAGVDDKVEYMDMLFDHDVDPSLTNKIGDNQLAIIIKNRIENNKSEPIGSIDKRTIQLLLDNWIDPHHFNKYGLTAITYASEDKGTLKIFEELGLVSQKERNKFKLLSETRSSLTKGATTYPRSFRPQTQMKTLGIKCKNVQSIKDPTMITSEPDTDHTFSLQGFPVYQVMKNNFLIPVTRYGQGQEIGTYGQEGLKTEVNFTWWYWEPDSKFFLYANKIYIAPNKMAACFNLTDDPIIENKIIGRYFEDYLSNLFIRRAVESLAESSPKMFSLFYQMKEDPDFPRVDEVVEVVYQSSLKSGLLDIDRKGSKSKVTLSEFKNFFRKEYGYSFQGPNDDIILESLVDPKEEDWNDGYTTWFRPINGNNYILFEEGEMDWLDPILQQLGIEHDLDAIILTHQPGNYGRLVSEVLDVRSRNVSYQNIYC